MSPLNRRELFRTLSSGLFVAYIAPTNRTPHDPIWPQWVKHLSDVEGEVTLGNSLYVVSRDELWKFDGQRWELVRSDPQ